MNHDGARLVTPLTTQQIVELQKLLIKRGYNIGEADGKVGSGTRGAIRQAQMKVGLPADSYPTAELIERLRAGQNRTER